MAYVFHGENPDDWHDEVFHYELRFVEPPAVAALEALGALYARTFGGGDASLQAIVPGAWRFSDRFAAFSVAAPSAPREAFRAVARFVAAVAAIAALDEVVHISAADDLPPLDPGPAFSPSRRPVDPGLPAPAASEAFEAAVAKARAGQRSGKLQALIDKVKPKEPKLRPFAPTPFPSQESYPASVRARFEGTPGHFYGPVDRPMRMLREKISRDGGGFDPTSHFSTATGRVELPAPGLVWPAKVAVHPSGERALFASVASIGSGPNGPTPAKAGYRVVEADLTTGSTRVVFDCDDAHGRLGTPAYLDEGHIAVPQDRRLTVVRLDPVGQGTSVAEAQFADEPLLFVSHGGELIAAETYKFVRLLGWVGNKLKPLAIYMHDSLRVHGEVDGGLVLRHGKHAPFVTTPTGVDLNSTYLLVEDPTPMLDALRPKARGKKARG